MAQNVPSLHHLGPDEDPLALPSSSWNLIFGQNPRLSASLAAHAQDIMSAFGQLAPDMPLPYTRAGHGHHVANTPGPRSATATSAQVNEDIWPVAPLLVRDLAGRVVHTGLNPLASGLQPHRFPADAFLLPPDHPLHGMLETEFFCLFRLLEWSPYTGVPLTGHPALHVRALYPNLQDYPYKIRPDTFYQDGFRLPQTERLFVSGGDMAAAAMAAEELQGKWEKRPSGQSYEAFYEASNGDTWFEDLFARGCTVIPTLEAFNGFFKVTDDYGMLDVWPGRVVQGLHEVVEERDDTSPAGTILEVRAPGFLTAAQCTPAKVVASNGSGYQSPHAGAPAPALPNLALPHPRVAPVWGSTWLPTHPAHFESPALWDWATAGHFQQVSGPLWDPVHYTYASTPRILKAYRNPHPHAPYRATVPEDMRPRFHPIVEPDWYDTVSDLTFQSRQSLPDPTPWQGSRLDMVRLGKPAASLGYHPLPQMYEYELAPEAFPELDPRHNGLPPCPADLKGRLLGIATSRMNVNEARKTMVILGENPRQEMLQEHWWNAPPYADLARYDLPPDAEPDEAAFALVPCYWPDTSASQLAINPKRLFNQTVNRGLDTISAGLAAAALKWQDSALSNRRRWHRLFRKYPGWYAHAWLLNRHNTPENVWQQSPEYGMPAAAMMLQNQRGAIMEVAKAVAVKRAPRLPARRRSAKVGGR